MSLPLDASPTTSYALLHGVSTLVPTEHGDLRCLKYVQVPKRIYTLEEMRLNKVEPTALLSPTDDTLNGVRAVLQASEAA